MTASLKDLIPPIADETSTPIRPALASVIGRPEFSMALVIYCHTPIEVLAKAKPIIHTTGEQRKELTTDG